MDAKTIVGVPGNWKSEDELKRVFFDVDRIAKSGTNPMESEYLCIGPVIMHQKSGFKCMFDICEHNPELSRVIQRSGQGRFEPAEIEKIAQHQSIAYLLAVASCDDRPTTGLLQAANHLLRSGGLGVLVESSGNAQPSSRWSYYAEEGSALSQYDAFVTMIGGDDFNYTCGMHAFGLPDVSLTCEYPIKKAPAVMNAFNQWNLLENPAITDGQLFATGLTEQIFEVNHCQYGYDEKSYLNNPYGRYHLTLTNKEFPPDKIYKQNDQPLFFAVPKSVTQECAEKARATISYFVNHFKSPFQYGTYIFKAFLRHGKDEAYIWLLLSDGDQSRLKGIVFEIPPELANFAEGTEITVETDDIFDWAIIRNSTLIGGYSMRVQREAIEPERRYHYDLYSGTLSYLPLEAINV